MRHAHKKQTKPENTASRAALIATVFIGTACTALLSFISLELGILGFGIFAVSFVLMIESRRRGFWEIAASYKFKTLFETQKNQEKDLLRHAFEIEGVKGELKNLKAASEKTAHMLSEAAKQAPVLSAAKPKTEEAAPVNTPPEGLLEALQDTPWKNRKPLNPDLNTGPRAMRPAQIIENDIFAASEPLPSEPPEPTEERFNDISDTVVRELVHFAVESKRVEVFVQPIMRLPQRQTRFYEIYARIRAQPGQYMPAKRYMKVSEQDNLQTDIDALLLMQCLQTIEATSHIEKAAPFFINIKAITLRDARFMKRLLGFLAQHRALASRLVFELAQREFEILSAPILEIVKGLGKLGCSFSLDHLTHVNMDVSYLMEHKVRFIKISSAALIKAQSNRDVLPDLQRTKRKLEANGIGVIVEKIETEPQLRSLLDMDIHYGQGYLFGKPELQGAYANRARIRRSENVTEKKA